MNAVKPLPPEIVASSEPVSIDRLIDERRWDLAQLLQSQAIGNSAGPARMYALGRQSVISLHMHDRPRAARELKAAAKIATQPAQASDSDRFSLAVHLERAGLPQEALRLLASVGGELAAQDDFAVLQARLHVAAENERTQRVGQPRIVALGQNCIPDDLTRRWGLGGCYVEGPFTAGMFYGDAVARHLDDDFASLRDPAAYRVSRSPDGHATPTMPAFSTILNHETGPYWTEGECARTATLYRRRVDAFRAALAAGPKLLLAMKFFPIDMARLLRSIETFAPAHRHTVLVVDVTATPSRFVYEGKTHVRWLHIPQPSDGYVWHEWNHYNTRAGFDFENTIVADIGTALRGLDDE